MYQPVAFAADDLATGSVRVTNKHLCTALDAYELRWAVTRDGEEIQHGTLAAPDVAPGAAGTVRVPYDEPARPEPGAEYWLDVALVLRKKATWAPAGHTVAVEQFALDPHAPAPADPAPGTLPRLDLHEDDKDVRVTGRALELVLSKATGTLSSYKVKGRLLLAGGPVPHLWRAPTDNDIDRPQVPAGRPRPGARRAPRRRPPGSRPRSPRPARSPSRCAPRCRPRRRRPRGAPCSPSAATARCGSGTPWRPSTGCPTCRWSGRCSRCRRGSSAWTGSGAGRTRTTRTASPGP